MAFDNQTLFLGDTGPTADQVTAFRAYARLARAQAASGDFYGAQANLDAANGAFFAMGSPSAYKDELNYATAAVYGGSGTYDTAGAGAAGAVDDVIAGQALTARGLVNSRPIPVPGFFASFSQNVDDSLSSLGSASSSIAKLGGIALAIALGWKLWR